MKKITVNQFFKHTGIPRSKVYYQIKKGHIEINEGKIDFENTLQLFNSKVIDNDSGNQELDFRQLINILTLQNLSLQRQLDLAYEREKNHLAELTCYRQHFLQKAIQNPPKVEGNTQIELENNVVDTNENCQNQMQSKIENQTHLKSCQSTKQEVESINEAGNSPLPTESIHNEISLPKSKSWDTEPKNESTEKNDDAFIGTPFTTQDDTKPLLNNNRHKKPKASIAKTKSTKLSYPSPIPKKQKVGLPTDQLIKDQDNLDKKDPNDYEY